MFGYSALEKNFLITLLIFICCSHSFATSTGPEKFDLSYGVEIEVNPDHHPKFKEMLRLYAPSLEYENIFRILEGDLPSSLKEKLGERRTNSKQKGPDISEWWTKLSDTRRLELFAKLKDESPSHKNPNLRLVEKTDALPILEGMEMGFSDRNFFYDELAASNQTGSFKRSQYPTLSLDPNGNYEYRGFIFDDIDKYKRWTELFKSKFDGGDIQGHVVWNDIGGEAGKVLRDWQGASVYLHDSAILERLKDECALSKESDTFVPFTNGSSAYLSTIGQSNIKNMLGSNSRERIAAPVYGNKSYGGGSSWGLEFRQYDTPSESHTLDSNSFGHLANSLGLISDVYKKDADLTFFKDYKNPSLIPPDSYIDDDCSSSFRMDSMQEKSKGKTLTKKDVACYNKYKDQVNSFLAPNIETYSKFAAESGETVEVVPGFGDNFFKKIMFLSGKGQKETKKKKSDRKIPLFDFHNYLFPMRDWLKDYPLASTLSPVVKKKVAQKSIAYFKNLKAILDAVPDDCMDPIEHCEECSRSDGVGVTLPVRINQCERFTDEQVANLIHRARKEVANWACDGELLDAFRANEDSYLGK